LQGLADAAGKGASWQSIATANGIENPRLLVPGQWIDLNVRTGTTT
jgi:nucleoid-associated protein YgaU